MSHITDIVSARAIPSPKIENLEDVRKECIDQLKSMTNSIFEKCKELRTKQVDECEQKFIEEVTKFDEHTTVNEVYEKFAKSLTEYTDRVGKIMATTIVSFAPSHAEENRFKQLYQLKKKQCHREIEIGLKEIFSKDISKLEMAAQISEERNCPIDQITEKDIEEKFAHNKREDADRRERLRQELIQEEDDLEKKKGKSPKAKKISAAHPKQKQNHEINTPAKPPVLKRPPAAATLSPAELRSKYLISLYERPTMQEHPRVTKRWRTKNAEEIRNFEDTLPSGERIKRYEKLSESQIRYLRACHYLPALEKIFAEGRDKSIYTFRTEKGVGMAAILHYDNQQYSGFINFGIGSDGILYHRFFEKTAPGKLFEAIQRKGEECLPAAPAKDEEKWTSTSKFNFDVLEDGAIHVSYSDEEHAITIFPIRKELMDVSLKS